MSMVPQSALQNRPKYQLNQLNQLGKAGALAALLLLLAGCAVSPHMPRTAAANLHEPAPTSISHTGRFSVRYDDLNGQMRNVYGHFNWHDDGKTVTLQLLTPLGTTLAIIKSSTSSATLELPRRMPQVANDIEALMQATLGFTLPVSGLRYWLQSLAAPASKAHIRRDPQNGQPTQIEQDGWTIGYAKASSVKAYSSTDAPQAPMKRMKLMRSYPLIEVKLVIGSDSSQPFMK